MELVWRPRTFYSPRVFPGGTSPQGVTCVATPFWDAQYVLSVDDKTTDGCPLGHVARALCPPVWAIGPALRRSIPHSSPFPLATSTLSGCSHYTCSTVVPGCLWCLFLSYFIFSNHIPCAIAHQKVVLPCDGERDRSLAVLFKLLLFFSRATPV